MIRAGLRRLVVALLVAVGGLAAISATFAALAGGSVPHALAIGYYLGGVACLVASIGLGSRGPTRAEHSDDPEDNRPAPFGLPVAGRRPRRKATPEEVREARLTSLGMFGVGLFLFMLGAAIDPARRLF